MEGTALATSSQRITGRRVFAALVWLSMAILVTDFLLRSWYGITAETRERCFIYSVLPRWLFFTIEHVVENFLIVLTSIFIVSVVEGYLRRFGRWLPGNPFSAVLYASVLPICSCGAVPLFPLLRTRASNATALAFILAAPLQNPYTIFLSFTRIGPVYGTARLVMAFAISIGVALLAGLFMERQPQPLAVIAACNPTETCARGDSRNPYEKTARLFRTLWPYVLAAGLLSLLFEYVSPKEWLDTANLDSPWWGPLLVTTVAIPLYLCNGADVFFLQPLFRFTNLPLGTGLAFSLASTGICISSILLFARYIGWRTTMVIIAGFFVVTTALAWIVNFAVL